MSAAPVAAPIPDAVPDGVIAQPVKKNRSRKLTRKVIFGAVAIFVALLWTFPVYWMIQSSLMTNRQLIQPTPKFFPENPTLDNYRAVISYYTPGSARQQSEFFSALQVSLAVTMMTVFFAIIIAFLAAIAISRFKFRGRKTFVFVILLIQMLPAEGLFIAQYKMMDTMGSYVPFMGLGSIGGITLFYVAAVVPFTIWMLRGFVAGVPADLEEAAMVDGLTRVQAFVRITLPLLAPGLVAAGVFGFIQAWNEYTIALVALGATPTNTLPLWLATFRSGGQTAAIDYGHVMASSALVAVPVIIFFMFVQGRMTSGLVSGAVKG